MHLFSRIVSLFLSFLLALSIGGVQASPLSADEESSETPAEKNARLMEQLRSERMQLRTGSFRGEGKFISNGGGKNVLEGPVIIFSVFDFSKGSVRLDRREPKREPTPDPNDDSQAWVMKSRGGQFARTPQQVLIAHDDNRLASIHPPATNPPDWARPLDVRVLGIAYPNEITTGKGTLEGMLEAYTKHDIAAVTEISPGIFRIESSGINKMPTVRRIQVIDTNQGCWPTSMELYYRAKTPSGWAAKPDFECSLTPIKIDGVWVPAKFSYRSDEESQELTFTWKSINRPVNDQLFTMDGFDQSHLEMIGDVRPEKPVVVSRPKQQRAVQRKNWLFIGVGVTACLAIIAGGCIIYARRHRR